MHLPTLLEFHFPLQTPFLFSLFFLEPPFLSVAVKHVFTGRPHRVLHAGPVLHVGKQANRVI